MANKFLDTSSNFTSANWKTIDATSYLNSTATAAYATGTYTATQNFTPGAITVEGVALRLQFISATPAGTFNVQLWNSTDAVQAALVTCNVADLATIGVKALGSNGWVYFKFASPVTLTAAKAHQVRVLSSSATQVSLHRDGTVNNYSRLLVTSTTGSVAANDGLYMGGNITGAGSVNTIAPTFDNTATTVFNFLRVGYGCNMTCQNSASTNYNLYTTALSSISGSFEVGNSVTRLDSTSSFTWECQSATAAGNSIIVGSGGTLRAFGTTKTRMARADANFSAGATSITTDISTGWKNGDLIGIGATSRAATPLTETKALTADAVGTTLTIAAVTNLKLGTAPVQAPLINLTSNINFRGSSATNTFYISLNGRDATLDLDSITCRYLGSVTTGARGIGIAALSQDNTFRVNSCAFYDLHASAIAIEANASTAQAGIIESTNNVQFGGLSHAYNAAATLSAGFTSAKFTGNWVIGCVGASSISINSADRRFEVKDNVVNGAQGSTNFVITTSANAYSWTQGEISGNRTEACAAVGFALGFVNTIASNFTTYRCNTYGIQTQLLSDSRINGLTSFGHVTGTLITAASSLISDMTIDSADVQSGVTETCPRGILTAANCLLRNFKFSNSNFGTVTQHSLGDIILVSLTMGEIILIDSTLGSTSQVVLQTALTRGSSVRIQKSGGVAGTNKGWWRQGLTVTDSTIYDPSTPGSTQSLRATPSSATEDLYFPIGRVGIPAGSGATITMKVRKSVIGDGAAYNGNQAKIIMLANAAAGSSFDTDQVVMTSTNAANGAWETLTYTIPTVSDSTALEFWGQVDGTTGWVNFDVLRVS